MKEVTVQIPNKKYQLFIEMMKSISFVKKVKTEEDEPTKEEILDGIRQAAKEVNLIKQGKLKPTSLKEFLNDL
jgi:hypothetical protein